MKKVLMIVQNDFVNDSRIIKEANALGKSGFEVKVLALHKSGLKEEENYDYFCVKRIRLFSREKLGKNKIAQVIKYIEFRKKCFKEAQKFLPDVVHCHDVYTLPIGEKIIQNLGGKKSMKLIYDSHELWSQASNNLTMPKILLKKQNSIEKRIIKKCDHVITVSDSIVNYLKDIYSLDKNPILIRNIPYQHKNIANSKLFHKELNLSEDKRIVLYQGAVGKGRGIEKLIDAIGYLPQNIVLVILGNGSMVDEYKRYVKELNIENRVYFHKAVDPSILINYTSSADLGVSMIKDICLSYYYSLPNKMFEYIQSEIPVICSDYPDMKAIVSKYKVGEVSNPDDSKQIAEAINKILANSEFYYKYKENCKLAKVKLNWECESEKLVELYKTVIN